jgi:hypothetical protein
MNKKIIVSTFCISLFVQSAFCVRTLTYQALTGLTGILATANVFRSYKKSVDKEKNAQYNFEREDAKENRNFWVGSSALLGLGVTTLVGYKLHKKTPVQKFLRASNTFSGIKGHWLTCSHFDSNKQLYSAIENAYPYSVRPLVSAFDAVNTLRDRTIDVKNSIAGALPEFEEREREFEEKAEKLLDYSDQTIDGFNNILKAIKENQNFLSEYDAQKKVEAVQESADAAKRSARAAESIEIAQWTQAVKK